MKRDHARMTRDHARMIKAVTFDAYGTRA